VGKCRERCWRGDWIVDLDIKGFLDASSHYTSVCGGLLEQSGKLRRDLDS
jgi:hypothetical protein